jgi:4a-hydroxytetrahydrobiopterin dehydratase
MSQPLPAGWIEQDDTLKRSFQRPGFVEALAFVVAVGRLAEAANHHPDIDIRYRTVHLSLCTHDAGNKVTAKDYALATKINELIDHPDRLKADAFHQLFTA